MSHSPLHCCCRVEGGGGQSPGPTAASAVELLFHFRPFLLPSSSPLRFLALSPSLPQDLALLLLFFAVVSVTRRNVKTHRFRASCRSTTSSRARPCCGRSLNPLFQPLSLSSLMIRPDQGRSLSLSLYGSVFRDLYLSFAPRHNSQRSQYQTVVEDFNWASGEFIRCSGSAILSSSSYPSHFTSKPDGAEGRAKADVVVGETQRKRALLWRGSDEGDRDRRRRVSFAEEKNNLVGRGTN